MIKNIINELRSRFFLACFLVVAIAQAILSIPTIDYSILTITGVSILDKVGSSSIIGTGKLLLAFGIVLIASVFLLVILALTWHQPGRMKRVANFVLVEFLLLTTPLWYFKDHEDDQVHNSWAAFKNIELIQLSFFDKSLADTLKRDKVSQAALSSLNNFDKFAESGFARAKLAIYRDWGIKDDNLGKAIYFAGLVGSRFEYGNKSNLNAEGCVVSNKIYPALISSYPTEQQFLSSRIGCCTDYAYLMKYLLDSANIPNKLVLIPGHIFNEIATGGQFYVVDATTGIIVNRPWFQLARLPNEVKQVYLIPLAGMLSDANSSYRPILGQFRAQVLLNIASERPVPWKYINALPKFTSNKASSVAANFLKGKKT